MIKYKATPGSIAFDVANHAAIILLMISMVYPFVFVISVSVSDFEAITFNRVKLLPVGPLQATAYNVLLGATNILTSYMNSIIYALGTATVTLVVTSLAAYVLEQRTLPFRKALIVFIVLTLFLPGYFIPTYLLVNQLGLVDTRLIVILLPSLSAWYILVMRANIRTVVTRELQEAALIDGANHLQIYVSLVLPLIKPILATIGLFAVVGSWNNFFLPLIYLNDRDKHPLTLILRRIVLEGEIGKYSGGGMAQLWDDQGVPGFVAVGFFKSFKFAAVVVTVWPIIVAYPFVQKYFVKGILVGSVKD
ncbi:MAG: carbohydrate ABC transporter permease [Spirochaetaceae bacterium]|nr:carbohydrate ABC transporter permease [Spirochaetaceae bacterium]